MKNMDRVILGSVLLIGLGFGLNAQACSISNWDGDSNIPANADVGSPETVSRFAQECALAVTDTSYVQSNGLDPDARYIGRFYVLPKLSGSGEVDLLVAYSDEGGAEELFRVAYDGTDFIFDATSAPGGGSGTAVAASGWNLIEFEFNSEGDFNFWVNEAWDRSGLSYAAPTGTFASGTGAVDAVQLGAPNGMASQSGTLTFDAFESHRSTSVGALLNCDAEGDQDVDINDILSIVDEAFGNPVKLAGGTPDCDLNGSININDVLEIVDILF